MGWCRVCGRQEYQYNDFMYLGSHLVLGKEAGEYGVGLCSNSNPNRKVGEAGYNLVGGALEGALQDFQDSQNPKPSSLIGLGFRLNP